MDCQSHRLKNLLQLSSFKFVWEVVAEHVFFFIIIMAVLKIWAASSLLGLPGLNLILYLKRIRFELRKHSSENMFMFHGSPYCLIKIALIFPKEYSLIWSQSWYFSHFLFVISVMPMWDRITASRRTLGKSPWNKLIQWVALTIYSPNVKFRVPCCLGIGGVKGEKWGLCSCSGGPQREMNRKCV